MSPLILILTDLAESFRNNGWNRGGRSFLTITLLAISILRGKNHMSENIHICRKDHRELKLESQKYWWISFWPRCSAIAADSRLNIGMKRINIFSLISMKTLECIAVWLCVHIISRTSALHRMAQSFLASNSNSEPLFGFSLPGTMVAIFCTNFIGYQCNCISNARHKRRHKLENTKVDCSHGSNRFNALRCLVSINSCWTWPQIWIIDRS